MMKKAILSPLCSAFVIPGLGQIINQHLKKGVCILSFVFILFVAGVFKLSLMVHAVLKEVKISSMEPETIMDRLSSANSLFLWCLIVAFAVLWFYSVLDAYLIGKKIDRQREGNNL